MVDEGAAKPASMTNKTPRILATTVIVLVEHCLVHLRHVYPKAAGRDGSPAVAGQPACGYLTSTSH